MSDLPVPDIYEGDEAEQMRRHYFNVGRVAVELASLEEVLAWLVWEVSQAGPGVGDIRGLLSSSRKLEDALERAVAGGGALSDRMAYFRERYLYFRNQRNMAAHSSIVTAFGGNPGEVALAMHHPRTNGLFKLPSVADVDVLLREIEEVEGEAYRLTHEIIEARMGASA